MQVAGDGSPLAIILFTLSAMIEISIHASRTLLVASHFLVPGSVTTIVQAMSPHATMTWGILRVGFSWNFSGATVPMSQSSCRHGEEISTVVCLQVGLTSPVSLEREKLIIKNLAACSRVRRGEQCVSQEPDA